MEEPRPEAGKSGDDFDAHLAGGAFENFNGPILVVGVEVLHFDFGHFEHLRAGQGRHFGFVGLLGTGGNFGRLLQQHRRRWLFGDESETFVFINSDHHRQNVTFVAGALPMPAKGNLNLPNRN